MNDGRAEERLIENFKKTFREATGKSVRIIVCSSIEAEANFSSTRVEPLKIVKLVLDANGWSYKETYDNPGYKGKSEQVMRRGLIDVICIANGNHLKDCGNLSIPPRDHTTVMNSIRTYQNSLETDLLVRRFFRETMSYIKENYHLFKNKIITKEDLD